MQWPPWSSSDDDSPRTTTAPPNVPPPPSRPAISSWSSPSLPNTWRHYTSPDVVLPTAVMTCAMLTARRLYVLYLRRIPGATRIGPAFWRRRSLLGTVTSVGDGDGFRLFHTPGGRLAGWGWLPGRRIPKGSKALKDKTISIRLAGIDAPESAHFGHAAQPGGPEAQAWLTSYVLGRRVRAHVHRKDQYDRAVATAYVRRWGGLRRADVGLQMLRRGLATVYEAKTGVEWGGLEARYRRAEAWARWRRCGIWAEGGGGGGGGGGAGPESPREYKDRISGRAGAGSGNGSGGGSGNGNGNGNGKVEVGGEKVGGKGKKV